MKINNIIDLPDRRAETIKGIIAAALEMDLMMPEEMAAEIQKKFGNNLPRIIEELVRAEEIARRTKNGFPDLYLVGKPEND